MPASSNICRSFLTRNSFSFRAIYTGFFLSLFLVPNLWFAQRERWWGNGVEKKFNYKIECNPGIDADFIQVPPLQLQPFVENAIWHGLMNKEGKGHLSINIQQENSTLICTIRDDGIGRKKTAELNQKSGKHKSMGMKITESRIARMQK